ncbi:MAG: hypothetical protein OCD01_02305 [Fibrobacterales bacterium]
MKIDNKKFAHDYAEIMRLTDMEAYSRAKTEVERVFRNHLGINFDAIHQQSIQSFSETFNQLHDAETYYIAGEILKFAATVMEQLDEKEITTSIKEKAVYLYCQALSANDPRINTVAEMNLCEVTTDMDINTLPAFLFTKLEVLNLQCMPLSTPVVEPSTVTQ